MRIVMAGYRSNEQRGGRRSIRRLTARNAFMKPGTSAMPPMTRIAIGQSARRARSRIHGIAIQIVNANHARLSTIASANLVFTLVTARDAEGRDSTLRPSLIERGMKSYWYR